MLLVKLHRNSLQACCSCCINFSGRRCVGSEQFSTLRNVSSGERAAMGGRMKMFYIIAMEVPW